MVANTVLNADVLVPAMSGISAFLSCIVASWPYLARNKLSMRIRDVAAEYEAQRRSRADGEQLSLRPEARKLFKEIFDRLNLAEQLNDTGMVRNLRMAGFRGQAPVVTFISARVLGTAALFTFASFYLFVALRGQYPVFPKLAIAMALALAGYYLPAVYVKNIIGKRQTAIRRAWPDALDFLLICVESGMALESALMKVSQEMGSRCPELADEFGLTTAELSYLPDRQTAYENLAERIGLDEIKSLVISLGQSEKYGTSLGQSLRVLAQESRDMRMMVAEKKAAALPPKLTVPMVMFFLPVLFAVILTPVIIQLVNAH